MNHNKLSKIDVFLLLSVLILFLVTCAKDPISSVPLTAIATSTIGPDGGVLETEDFSLQVPAGSFANETTLNLYISPDPSDFGENSISQAFMVEGIPEVIENPMRLAIKFSDELSDSSYISHSVLGVDITTGDTTYVSYFMTITDSMGFLVSHLYPISEEYFEKPRTNNSEVKFPNVFEAITKEGRYKTDHFTIDYSKIYSEATVEQFANLMENTLDKIVTDLGFSYNNEDPHANPNSPYSGPPSCIHDNGDYQKYCWQWPIYITIKDIQNYIYLGYPRSWMFSNGLGPFINADETMMGSSIGSQAELLIAKTLLEIAQKSNRNYYPAYWWFGESIQYWIEEYFGLINGGDPPSIWTGSELAPFNGMQKGWDDFSNANRHERGMVSFIKYLVDNNMVTDKGLAKIFQYMNDNDVHIVNALLNSVNGLVADWWPDFFEKLIGGDIYNVSSTVFTNSTNISETWDINTDINTLKVFNYDYADLSAKMFIVNLNHSNIDESASLYLDAYRSNAANNDGVATLVFGVNTNNNLEHLVTAKNSTTVLPKKLKEYYDNGTRKFLVVVVNSTHNATDYLGITDIDLAIEVKKEEPTLYTTCEVEVKYSGEFRDVTEYDSPNLTDTDVTSWRNYGFTFEDTYSGGSFSGNTFNYDYVEAFDNGNTYDIHFSLTISDDKSEIANIDYTYYSSFDGNAGTSENDVFHNLVSIPLEQVDAVNNEATYYIGGVQTCNSIPFVTSSYDHVIFDVSHTTKNLVDYMCDQNSFIRIKLK